MDVSARFSTGHRAKMTHEWCKANFLYFITSAPNSSDLSAMDYIMWSILEARTCSQPHSSLETLKQSKSIKISEHAWGSVFELNVATSKAPEYDII